MVLLNLGEKSKGIAAEGEPLRVSGASPRSRLLNPRPGAVTDGRRYFIRAS
jgi:hypothetical protein